MADKVVGTDVVDESEPLLDDADASDESNPLLDDVNERRKLAGMGGGDGEPDLECSLVADVTKSLKLSQEDTAQRKTMPEDEFGDPENRKFPIKDQSDVDAAAHLIGKASNPGAVRKRIVAIAKRKGFKIPDAWQNTSTPTIAASYNEDETRDEGGKWTAGGASAEKASDKAHEATSKAWQASDKARKEKTMEANDEAFEAHDAAKNANNEASAAWGKNSPEALGHAVTASDHAAQSSRHSARARALRPNIVKGGSSDSSSAGGFATKEAGDKADNLSGAALQASIKAFKSGSADDHMAAAKAHRDAANANSAVGMHKAAAAHNHEAAEHVFHNSKILNDAANAKAGASAKLASAIANGSGRAEDHLAAMKEHQAAAKAAGEAGDVKSADRHAGIANRHAATYSKLNRKKEEGK